MRPASRRRRSPNQRPVPCLYHTQNDAAPTFQLLGHQRKYLEGSETSSAHTRRAGGAHRTRAPGAATLTKVDPR